MAIFLIFADEEVLQLMQHWRVEIESKGNVTVGHAATHLAHDSCGSAECNLGNFYTDAIYHSFLQYVPQTSKQWSNVSVALITAGELYLSIRRGPITHANIFELAPYDAPLVAFNLRGDYVLAALEHSVSGLDLEMNVTRTNAFLQVAGLRVTYDIQAPINQRVVDVSVRCTDCEVPHYQPLNLTVDYRVVATRYVTTGGYGYSVFTQHATDHIYYQSELDTLLEYLGRVQNITKSVEGRITFL